MEITVGTQSNKVGSEYMEEGKQSMEIHFYESSDEIIISMNGTRYDIPAIVFRALLQEKK